MSGHQTVATRRELVYLLAPSYTGSTLLTFLLSNHKDIATIGELKATARGNLDTYRCSCGLLQRDCAFWQAVAAEMRKAHPSFTLDDFGTDFRAPGPIGRRLLRAGVRGQALESLRGLMLHAWPGSRQRFDDILTRNQQLIEVICRLQNKTVFLDSSKDPIRLRLLHAAPFWRWKVIYLIRDGRGAANSYMRHYHTSMDVAAAEWCRTHGECERVLGRLPKTAWMTVHYEQLCTHPKDTLAAIHGFLGLDHRETVLQLRSSGHHILGNEMRLGSLEEITLDEKWKTALTPQDLEVFEQRAGAWNRTYGYGTA